MIFIVCLKINMVRDLMLFFIFWGSVFLGLVVEDIRMV